MSKSYVNQLWIIATVFMGLLTFSCMLLAMFFDWLRFLLEEATTLFGRTADKCEYRRRGEIFSEDKYKKSLETDMIIMEARKNEIRRKFNGEDVEARVELVYR